MPDFLNPSTPIGALVIGIIAGLISGSIIGFFSGKSYQIRKVNKISSTNNSGNIIQGSTINTNKDVLK